MRGKESTGGEERAGERKSSRAASTLRPHRAVPLLSPPVHRYLSAIAPHARQSHASVTARQSSAQHTAARGMWDKLPTQPTLPDPLHHTCAGMAREGGTSSSTALHRLVLAGTAPVTATDNHRRPPRATDCRLQLRMHATLPRWAELEVVRG